MSRAKKNSLKNPITMPIGFYERIFIPSLDQAIIKKGFFGNQDNADDFISAFKILANRLSDDFLDDKLIVAIAKDEECGGDPSNFFLHPKDDNKIYRVNGQWIPSQDGRGYGHNDKNDEHNDVFVDSKVFGLIATLCTFDDYWMAREVPIDNERVCDVYMDRGQDLNEIILEIDEEFKAKKNSKQLELDAMMKFVWFFLRPRWDDLGQMHHPLISYH